MEMENSIIPIQFSLMISNEDINDLLDIAATGGITYWCGELKVREWKEGAKYKFDNIALGGVVTLCDCESDDKWDLNKEKLLAGIQAIIADPNYDCPLLYNNKNKCLELDLCDIDANIADNIVQFALFGRQVFA